MRRTVVALLVGMCGLAGCSSTIPGQAQPPTGAATSAGAASSSSPSDVGACFDGECEITVSNKTSIPLDTLFGIDSLSAEVLGTGRVRVAYRGIGGSGEASLSDNGAVSIGGITVRVLGVSGGAAQLRFTKR